MPQAERAKTRTSSTLSYKSFSSDKNFRSDSLRVDAGLRDQSFMSRISDVRRERKLQERNQRSLHHGGTEARRRGSANDAARSRKPEAGSSPSFSPSSLQSPPAWLRRRNI